MTDSPFLTQAEQFLGALFPSLPENYWILIWTLPDKKSSWFDNVDAAADYAIAAGAEKDVYVEMSLAPRPIYKENGGDARVTERESVGFGCLWADIDVGNIGHKKAGIFLTDEDAHAFIEGLPLAPTIVVNSGHGYHLYWCFKELWLFEDDAERQKAIALLIRWRESFKVWAEKAGRVVDTVGDLARVMRVPGTFNRKMLDMPRRVYIETMDSGRAYDPSGIEEFLILEVPQISKTVESYVKSKRQDDAQNGNYDFILNPDAEVPTEKWHALRELDHRAIKSFNHERKDFKLDNSPSAYDMSLASLAVSVDWTNQEIVDLLIASRRINHCDLKLSRPDYYAATIRTARRDKQSDESADTLIGVDVKKDEDGAVSTDGSGPNVYDVLESIFGFRVLRFVQYKSSDSVFRLETTLGDITLGSISAVRGQRSFGDKVAELAKINLRKFSATKWDKIVQCLLDICEVIDMGTETTDVGQVDIWMGDYLTQWKPAKVEGYTDSKLSGLMDMRVPYVCDMYVYIFLDNFRDWVMRSRNNLAVTKNFLASMLRASGWENYPFNCTLEGRHTTKYVYRMPYTLEE